LRTPPRSTGRRRRLAWHEAACCAGRPSRTNQCLDRRGIPDLSDLPV